MSVVSLDRMDPKTGLNQFCQRYCSRPVTKNDILYKTTKFGNSQFQAVVTLSCLEGQEYAGELSSSRKSAEKSAAQQALQAYSAISSTLLQASAVHKKCRVPGPLGVPQPFMFNLGNLPNLEPAVPGVPGVGAGGAAEHAAAKQGAEGGEPEPGASGENPALTDKAKLNAACMKIVRRALRKGETLYETRQVGISKSFSGYQSTVRLMCLPEIWANQMFPGQVCANKQGAEQSAAGVALAAIMADPELSAQITKVNTAPAQPKANKKSKGKGGGAEQAWRWKGGWSWSASGPDLPRERVSETAITGEVLEWKGTFGWVKCSAEIDHPAASRRGGKVYVHQRDLLDDVQELSEGASVSFQLYVDPSGLGGEEVALCRNS
mmetsp:Transcript_20849/g.58507  ORF Transcript_20849/g.58507 Transcript_20849/m.58507 type:complete len:378 (+) Transcript_20849:184-1317(+)